MSLPGESSPSTEALLIKHRGRLLRRVQWMLPDVQRVIDADDFFGEMARRVWDHAGDRRWHDEDHFVAYATKIARNLIIDQGRRRAMRHFESLTASFSAGRVVHHAGAEPEQHVVRDEEAEALLAAMEQLASDHQRVLELRDWDGLSFREIGEAMGRSPDAAQVLHMRAMTKLGMLLGRRR
ncbi:MAG: sigma-70 family RNA polymerase sigma factor [Planctomycetes bacterium]|nr:sigma-70 family RNA polymerase sigma factor [Planctomycetota bacterium]